LEKQNRELIAGFLGASAALIFFGWLTNVVLAGESMRFDNAVRNAIHTWASPPLTFAMLGITQLGSAPALVTLGVLVIWRLTVQRRRQAVLIFIAACVGAEALSEMLKVVFRRQRPEAFFGYAEPITYSFPSGHSMMSACFYGVIAAILTTRMASSKRRIAIWAGAAFLAVAIGFSRVYLGVHYPSDVLAGYATAAIWVGTVRVGYEIWLRRSLAS
jgi:undecaprenyl-diphosphatase